MEAINTAPEWFLEKSADILGRINAVLRNYSELPINFGAEFFYKDNINGTKQYYAQMSGEAVEQTYKPICTLINKFTDWLYENVDTLSVKLCIPSA